MKIAISSSDLMNEQSKHLSLLEHKIIRIPFELRDINQISVNNFINLKSKDNEIITLKVEYAYKVDVEKDALSAYVTEDTLRSLYLEDTERKTTQEIEVVNGITLGCDPEFFLVNKKNNFSIINASDLFKKFGQIGYDGVLMEIRPSPNTSEVILTRNMWDLIKEIRGRINNHRKVDGNSVSFMAASYYCKITAGFHLHYGLPKQLIGGRPKSKRDFIQSQIARAMDYYVGIPAVVSEGEYDWMRRGSTEVSYGKPSDKRSKYRTLEYRTPGGSLLRHPILTQGILGLGAVVMEDAVSRIKLCTNKFANLENVSCSSDIQDIYPNIPNTFNLFESVCSKDLTLARKHLEVITNDVNEMVGFKGRQKSIECFLKCLHNKTEFGHDIEEGWRSYYEK